MRSREIAARIRKRVQRRYQLEGLEARQLLAADPIIAEFQALNTSTRRDDDGDAEDWIEIYNPDSAPIHLAGWHLTDDETDLNKWTFPAVTVGPGQHLVVSASNKDRRDAQHELHTNFRLSGDGEFLALVRPDGTIAQSFAPYPAQFEDQSYGLAAGRTSTVLFGNDASVSARVPLDGSLGLDWVQPNFDTTGWQVGQLGVGYERLQPGFTERFDFDGPLDPQWTVDVPADGTSTVSVANGRLLINTPTGQTMSSSNRGLAPLVKREIPGSAADWEMIAQVTQGTPDRGNTGLTVLNGETGLPVLQFEYSARLNFRLLSKDVSVGSVVSLNRESYFLRLVRDSRSSSYSAYFRLTAADEWRLVGTAVDGDDVPTLDHPQVGIYARTPSSTMTAQYDFVEFQIPDQAPIYGPQVRFDVGAAMDHVNPSVYLRIPFEITGDPQQFDELALITQYDDGFRAFLNGVEVTAQNVPIEAAWNSAAGGEFGAVNGRIPTRQYDLSSFRQQLRSGHNILAIQGMNVSADDTDFFFNGSLVGADIVGNVRQYFTTPSPGETNPAPAAAPPRVIGQDGIFFGSTSVELALQDPNPQFEIRYTIDGSEPTPTSPLYTQSLTLTTSAMLQARVFDRSPTNTLAPSPMASATFIAVAEELRERTSNIPLIILDTLGQGLPGSGATSLASVNVAAFDVSQATGRSALVGGQLDYLGRGGIRDRGSSTAGQPKPNLAFETWGEDGINDDDDESVGLLGFAPESDWVLHAPYTFDRALMRNQLAFALTNSLDRWAPGTRPVEVFINRSDGVVTPNDYAGVYVLMDKIKQGPDRVDIAKITPADNTEPNISGGYIWKIDRADPGEAQFTAGGTSLNWVEPKSPSSATASVDQRATLEQQQWVIDYFNKFRDASRNPNISDPEGYSKYIDVDSWIDNHLMYVLGDNVDALNLSTYLFKDRDKKIEFGPQWDYDRAMESDDGRDDNPLLWGGSGGTAFFTSNLWSQLFRDPGFWQRYVDRWTELRRDLLSDNTLDNWIDKLAGELSESAERNAVKWTASRGRRNSPYVSGKLDGTWRGEVEHLRSWIHARAQFMDSTFVAVPNAVIDGNVLPIGGTAVAAGTEVSLDGPRVTYFEDREIISTTIGAAQASYFMPTDDSLGTQWAQPTFDDTAWATGPLGIGFDSGSSFGDYIRTEVTTVAGGTTILTRTPFDLPDLTGLDNLVLRVRYDDGFVAYLNGVEIVRRNLRDDNLAWNSRANTHVNADGQRFEDQDISEFRHLLVAGRNVLAIRAVNASATSTDMLIQPALVSRQVKFGLSPQGKVYYTTDGSDPRGADGNPSPQATLSERGQRIPITQNTRLIARNFDDVTDLGLESRIVRTKWSAPAEFTFVVTDADLTISEINYHPSDPSIAEAAAGWTAEDFEFVEIHNAGSAPANLVGTRLAGGVNFDFFKGSIRELPANGYALIVANQSAFQQRYGSGLPIAGEFSGRLDNLGERLAIVDALGIERLAVAYQDNDRWGLAADGVGATLVLRDASELPSAASGKWYHWTTSREPGGSPGSAGLPRASIVINEVLARGADDSSRDAIELLNVGGQSIDLSGWFLSDSSNQLLKYRLPAGTVLAAGQSTIFDERQFSADNPQPGDTPFGLNGLDGESVWLVTANEQRQLTSFVDDVHFDTAQPGEALGRFPNGVGRLAPQLQPTLGRTNVDPRIGPVVISEVMYHAVPTADTLAVLPQLEPADLDFVELHNPTTSSVDLAGWKLRGGIDFDFAAGTSLVAGERIVVLRFNPDNPENVRRLNAFHTQYQLTPNVRLVGGYAGQLADDDDLITLRRPDAIAVGYAVQVDEILYDNQLPWPAAAAGLGSSLSRGSAESLGNLATSWSATRPSPGTAAQLPSGDFDEDGRLTATDINLLFAQLRSAAPDPRFDLNGDGAVNSADRDLLVGSLAGTTYGDIDLDGRFDSSDLVRSAQAGQYEDNVVGNSGWEQGDWDGDGDFTTRDFVLAFQRGGYVAGPPALPAIADSPGAADDAFSDADLLREMAGSLDDESDDPWAASAS